jgi:hypothetical protein
MGALQAIVGSDIESVRPWLRGVIDHRIPIFGYAAPGGAVVTGSEKVKEGFSLGLLNALYTMCNERNVLRPPTVRR